MDLSGIEADAVLHVGRFVLEPTERRLLIDGRPLAIGSRAFAVLHLLARQRGRAVRAEQLLLAVWAGQPVVASNLRVQVTTLRKLLGTEAIASSKVDGYRLALDVRVAAAPARLAMPGNLPEHLADIHGRDAELQQLAALLAGHDRVTLAGPAGVGKTTLSRACAHALWPRYADGVWWVELAALQSASPLTELVANTLGLPPRSGINVHTLAHALAQHRLLLVLDNCEHLADAVTALADALLSAAPYVVLLATSRRTLRCAGEQVLRLPPLSLPPLSIEGGTGLAEARRSGAVAWFVARAQRADPGFQLTAANVEAVVRICRQLDGVALAIGLAAARVPVLGVTGLHDRLHERLRLLVGRELDARGQPLALLAALDWSHDLLSPVEQTVLRGLAVFAGSFSLQAVEAVLGDDQLDKWAVLDALHALIDHSLLSPVAAVLQAGAAARYTLHESLRLYARGHLDASGQAQRLQQRHAEHFLGEAPSAQGPAMQAGLLQRSTLDDADHDNLRAALAWATEHDLPLALQLVIKHCGYMRLRGHHLEAEQQGAALLADPRIQAWPLLAGRVHIAQVSAVYERGEIDLAHRHVSAALALLEPLDATELVSNALAWAATLYLYAHELDAAEAVLMRSIAIERQAGLQVQLVSNLNNLCCLLTERGRFSDARRAVDEALALATGLQYAWGQAVSWSNLGELAYAERDWSAAMAHWLRARPAMQQLGHKFQDISQLHYQGLALRRQGQPAAALASQHESLRMALAHQLGGLAADILCALAALAQDAGQPRRAAVLLQVAMRGRKDTAPIGPTLVDLSETEAAVRAALSAADWHAARAEGDSLTAEQVLAQETATG